MSLLKPLIVRHCLTWPLTMSSASSCQLRHTRSIVIWEGGSRKYGYEHKMPQRSFGEKMKLAMKVLPREIYKFGAETIHDHTGPITNWDLQNGDYKYEWNFQTKQHVDEWLVSTDADMDIGYSSASAIFTDSKCLRFHGYLDTKIFDDGKTKYAGYVNLSSPLQLKSFFRVKPYDWSMFTHLVIRCRGDGRPYHLNVHMENYYDVSWHDMYGFQLYTRGGPYWQIAKIPLSKFLRSNKGRIQDRQYIVPLDRIRQFSFTLSDQAVGPFQLDIDYIGLVYDANHPHIFWYEMYDGDPLLS